VARIGISITKTISFRGAAQEFSNTYYYDAPEPLEGNVVENAVDLLVTKEKAIHASTVTFLRGRAWTAGGTEQQNNMLVDKQLSGAGAVAPHASLDRERAILVRFRAGVDSKGRPVYLRKWWHLDVFGIDGVSYSNAQLAQTGTLSTAQQAAIVAMGNGVKQIAPTGASGPWNLVSPKGRAITGSTEAHKYLEHHQLGDMWRG
jgi:hypothetical protein